MTFIAAWENRYLESYVEALAEGFHLGNVSDFHPTVSQITAIEADFPTFVEAQRNPSPIIQLPNGHMVNRGTSEISWWINEGEFVGAFEIRRDLPSALHAAYAGHFSIGVRPSRRGRAQGDHAGQMMLAGLHKMTKHGMKLAMACCRQHNLASQGLMLRFGAVLMDEVPIEYSGYQDVLRRYIIPLDHYRGSAA